MKLHAHFNDPDKPITNIDDNEDFLLNKYKKSSSSWTPSDVHPSIEKVFKTSRETLLYKKSSLNVSRKIPLVLNIISSIVEFCLLLEKTIYNIYLMMLTLVKCLKTILLDLFAMKSLCLII